MVYCTLSCTYLGGGLIEVFNHKVTGLLSFVTELKKGCFLVGADEGSQEPFLSEGTSTLPLFLWFEKCMEQQLQWTEMLLEFENLTFSFFSSSFLFFKSTLPLFGKLCAKEPVSYPPPRWADVALLHIPATLWVLWSCVWSLYLIVVYAGKTALSCRCVE